MFDAVDGETRALFERELTGHELVFFLRGRSRRSHWRPCPTPRCFSVFVSSPLSKECLQALPKLRAVAARSTGYDHIDLAAAKAQHIVITNVPVYGARTIAEYSFALMLALSRKAYAAYDRLRRDGTTDVKDYEGFDLGTKRSASSGRVISGRTSRVSHRGLPCASSRLTRIRMRLLQKKPAVPSSRFRARRRERHRHHPRPVPSRDAPPH